MTAYAKWVVHGRPDSAILICQMRPAFICRNGMLMLSMPCSIRQASSRGVHHKPEARTHTQPWNMPVPLPTTLNSHFLDDATVKQKPAARLLSDAQEIGRRCLDSSREEDPAGPGGIPSQTTTT